MFQVHRNLRIQRTSVFIIYKNHRINLQITPDDGITN